MNKTEFLALVEEQLRDVFKEAQLGSRSMKTKHRCEGFCKCGRVLGIVDEKDLTQLMEQVYKDVYGMTIAEREAQKLELSKKMEANEYQNLDIPAFLRKGYKPPED